LESDARREKTKKDETSEEEEKMKPTEYVCPQCKGKMRAYDPFERATLPCPTCEGEGTISEKEAEELKREGYKMKLKRIVPFIKYTDR
jgi:DnaJ-class molecular chaperone